MVFFRKDAMGDLDVGDQDYGGWDCGVVLEEGSDHGVGNHPNHGMGENEHHAG